MHRLGGNAEILARSRDERFQLAFARPLGVVIERVDLRAVAIIPHKVDRTCSSSLTRKRKVRSAVLFSVSILMDLVD